MNLNYYKKWMVGLVLLISAFQTWGQVTVTNKGVSITNTGSIIYFNGNYVHDSTSQIANGGIIHFRNDVTNTANNRMFVTEAGKVVIDGVQPQNIAGDSAINFYKLEINKPSNDLTLNQNIKVNDTLKLLVGSIDLNGNVVDLSNTGELANESNANRIFGAAGKIRARRNLNFPELKDNIAGIGIYVSADENFSIVNLERSHVQQTYNGDTSILRYYNFVPETPGLTGLIDSIKISYFDSEMIPGEYLYKIYASVNDGTDWKNKGGLVDTVNNFVVTTTFSPPAIGKFRASIFPIESFATCLPNDPNYISAVFLVSTTVIDGDSVQFIQLSSPNPQVYSWNFGDGNTSLEYHPVNVYNLQSPNDTSLYQVTMTVTNGTCSDTRKKSIKVYPDFASPKLGSLFNGIEYFNIYPNPNSGSFKLEVKTTDESDINIFIVDMHGRLIHSKGVRSSSYKDELNMEDLQSGIYFIKIQVKDELRVVKMIKY